MNRWNVATPISDVGRCVFILQLADRAETRLELLALSVASGHLSPSAMAVDLARGAI